MSAECTELLQPADGDLHHFVWRRGPDDDYLVFVWSKYGYQTGCTQLLTEVSIGSRNSFQIVLWLLLKKWKSAILKEILKELVDTQSANPIYDQEAYTETLGVN